MSTNISLRTTTYQVGNRQFLLEAPRTKVNLTLDVSKFTANTHFPNGYIPAGTVVGKLSSGGKGGPYSNAASDGTETAYGVTYDDALVVENGVTQTSVGVAVIVNEAIISASKMPFTSGAGAIDANGKADLAQIRWEA